MSNVNGSSFSNQSRGWNWWRSNARTRTGRSIRLKNVEPIFNNSLEKYLLICWSFIKKGTRVDLKITESSRQNWCTKSIFLVINRTCKRFWKRKKKLMSGSRELCCASVLNEKGWTITNLTWPEPYEWLESIFFFISKDYNQY